MKKLILTFLAVGGFAFSSSAQCDAQSTLINTECGSTCYSIRIDLTGITSVDIANWYASGGTMRRKPTIWEITLFADQACN